MSAKAEHYDVIRAPVITEKSTMASENGAVVFEVAIDSNKPMIKEAVEALFGVKVKAVNTTITKGKVKRFRGQLGKRKDVKKAYVTLEEGNTIDVTSENAAIVDNTAAEGANLTGSTLNLDAVTGIGSGGTASSHRPCWPRQVGSRQPSGGCGVACPGKGRSSRA